MFSGIIKITMATTKSLGTILLGNSYVSNGTGLKKNHNNLNFKYFFFTRSGQIKAAEKNK